MDIIKAIKGRTVFITGSDKNAGKTTLLNYALACVRPAGRTGYLSAGIDGERQDMITGSPKPPVLAERGDLFITSESALAGAGASCEILQVYPFRTAIGRPVLARALRGGRIEISGPENNLQLGGMIGDLRARGAFTVLVDGAADRITQAAGGGLMIYVVRAEPSNLSYCADRVRLLCALSRVRCRARGAALEGALTPSRAEAEEKGRGPLVIEDLTKVFLSRAQWDSLASRRRPVFSRALRIAAIVVNLYNVTEEQFRRAVGDEEAMKTVLFNPFRRPLPAAQQNG